MSSNGTIINGVEVSEPVALLHHGDGTFNPPPSFLQRLIFGVDSVYYC
jgi:hypothetical protein